jgi:hypothetical protein
MAWDSCTHVPVVVVFTDERRRSSACHVLIGMAPAELESPQRAQKWTLRWHSAVSLAALHYALSRYVAFVAKSSDVEVWRAIEQFSLEPYEQRLRAAGVDVTVNNDM